MGKYRLSRDGFSWSRLFLVILIVICCAAIVWTGNLLFTNQISITAGIIVILAAIGVLIWNISLQQRYKARACTVFAVFIVTILIAATVCAFSGVEPLSTMKQELTTSIERFTGQTQEQFLSDQKYPAHISGRVVIADKVIAKNKDTQNRIELISSEDKVWWVIDISVKNIGCEEEITASYDRWAVEADAQIYYAKSYMDMIPASYPMNVIIGQTGQTTFRFLVPDGLRVGEAKLIYQGSGAAFYGTLSGGEKVPLYDWDSRTVVKEPIEDYIVSNKRMQLRTIANWQGSESTPIRFKASKSPWVVNWKYEKVSKIGYKFDILVIDEAEYEILAKNAATNWASFSELWGSAWSPDKYGSIVVPKAGNFVVLINASGVKWWVKVGVE